MAAHHSRPPAAPPVHLQRCQPARSVAPCPAHFHFPIPTWVSPLGATALLCPPPLSPETLLFIRTAKRRRHSKSSAHNLCNLSPAPHALRLPSDAVLPTTPCPAARVSSRPIHIFWQGLLPPHPSVRHTQHYPPHHSPPPTPHTSYARTAATNDTLPYTPHLLHTNRRSCYFTPALTPPAPSRQPTPGCPA